MFAGTDVRTVGDLGGTTSCDLSEGGSGTFHFSGGGVRVDGRQALHGWGHLLSDALNVVLHRWYANYNYYAQMVCKVLERDNEEKLQKNKRKT